MIKKIIFFIFLTICVMINTFCFASEFYLSDDAVLYNGQELSGESVDGITLTNKMNNGSLEENALKENVAISNIITISKPGKYIFSGNLSDGQIAIDANKINGQVNIILNNVNINCNNAPAIFVYSRDINNEKCKVNISTAIDSINEIKGGKLKVSVEDINNQEEINYYIEKGYDDDNTYYERYKYDGAISSDISLNFSGEGILNVYANKKEGIESKMNITIDGGTYIIKSLDDAINASSDGKSIITIKGGTVVAYLLDEAEEGDGIDSNGYIYINGGTVYAFACSGADNGLDSDKGTYINGGVVISTGSMYDSIIVSENINSAKAIFPKNLEKGENICVVDKDNNIVFAMKTDRNIKNFIYASEKLDKDEEYSVYTNVNLEGDTNEWDIYTNVISSDLTNAVKNEFNDMSKPDLNDKYNLKENNNNLIAKIFLMVATLLFIVILVFDMKSEDTNVKIKIINLIVGLIIGILLSIGIIILIASNNYKNSLPRNEMGQMNFEDRPEINMHNERNKPN